MRKLTLSVMVVTCAALLLGIAACADTFAPLGMPNANVGGGRLNDYTLGVANGTGLNNIGLLIRTWGKVVFVDADNKYFYIDDGTHIYDGGGQSYGVRVGCDDLPAGMIIAAPNMGMLVSVTGVSTSFSLNGQICRLIRPRNPSDIIYVGQAPP